MYIKKAFSNKGQLSVFFGMSLVLMISVVAFVANVGILVKSKINLQNAVDAAAFAGAATQSRLLSNIAYVNWEMRNTYKEWMFKYYVLGQISNPATNLASFNPNPSPGQKMDFRLPKFDDNEVVHDKWNIPSICIKFNAERSNLCGIFTTPGLPRHEAQGAVGVDEVFNQALNEMTKAAASGCVKRSVFNLQTALLWAYGSGDSSVVFSPQAPQIAAQRPGAWTEAIQLALRVRNLEWLVNQPPQSRPICLNGNDCTDVRSLDLGQDSAPLNERPVKAFWSAYRNLGNSDSRGANEMKQSFQLTELPPSIGSNPPANSLNYLFTPSAYTKHYLDLQVYINNFVTFYTTFIPQTDQDTGSVDSQASCAIAKMGLPVPGYPLGFVKNPETLTYYAVKGEADFNGLFNPFNSPIRLKTYAAAKPYGGRIGPMLFRFNPSKQGILPRNSRSFPYISAITNPLNAPFQNGDPVPSNSDFWATSDTEVVGGLPDTNTTKIKFTIPNLVYDIPESGNSLDEQNGGALRFENIISNNNPPLRDPTSSPQTTEFAGLFDAAQFKMLRDAITNTSGVISKDDVDEALVRARRPTRYETLNYMLPTFSRPGRETNDGAGDNFESQHVGVKGVSNGRDVYTFYAPLFKQGLLFSDPSQVRNVILDHITRNQLAVEQFSEAIHEVAEYSRAQDSSSAQGLYQAAANSLHDNPAAPDQPRCPSLAGQFRYFFTGNDSAKNGDPNCNQKLEDVIVDAITNNANNFPSFSEFLTSTTPSEPDHKLSNADMKSAYAPGPRQGGNPTGEAKVSHPFLPIPDIDVHRNFYSTKLISMRKLLRADSLSYLSSQIFMPYSEGVPRTPTDLQQGGDFQFANPVNPQDLNEFDINGLGWNF